MDLFREMLGKDRFRREEADCYMEIAALLGYLPPALKQAIALMLLGPGYPAGKLRDKLQKEDSKKGTGKKCARRSWGVSVG